MEAGCYAKLMLTLLAVICFTRHCRPYLRIFGWPLVKEGELFIVCSLEKLGNYQSHLIVPQIESFEK